MIEMGNIYLYYGTGGGKTAASLGLALRSVAHDHRVVIIQFLKHWKETGEVKAAEKLGPLYKIKQFGRPGWIKSQDGAGKIKVGGFEADLRAATPEDKEAAEEALAFAEQTLKKNPPELLILDEVCLAAYMGILDTADVLSILEKVPDKTDIVLTGRYTPDKLLKRADFVNEVREIKAPRTFISREGIQF